jgi:hypothetical protein
VKDNCENELEGILYDMGRWIFSPEDGGSMLLQNVGTVPA